MTPEEIIDDATKGSRIYWSGYDVIKTLTAAGYKIVPLEPTMMMREAGEKEIGILQSWKAMLKAAP